MDTLTALKMHGPWVAMGDLVKLTGQDAPTLRAELKEKLEAKLVQKTGQKRGTRYALPDAKVPESKDDLNFRDAILKVMEEAQDHVSRKLLCEKIGTYDAKIRPDLLALVDEGIVVDNGKKKGQLFWLARHEESGLVEAPEPKVKAPSASVKVSNSEKPVVTDVEELVRMGVNSLMVGYQMTCQELKSEIMSVAQHNFSSSDIFSAFARLLKNGELPRMKKEERNEGGNGWRMFYWRDSL